MGEFKGYSNYSINKKVLLKMNPTFETKLMLSDEFLSPFIQNQLRLGLGGCSKDFMLSCLSDEVDVFLCQLRLEAEYRLAEWE